MASGINGLGVQNFNNRIGINNNLGVKPNFSTTACREEGKHVTVNGKQYNVVKVQDKKIGVFSFQPMYKEVVVIDGKQYDVKEVNDWMACDKTKQVIVVDGKPYDVKKGEAFNLDLFNGGITPRICYNV